MKEAFKVISILRKKYKLDVKLDIYGVSPLDTEKAIKHYTNISREYGVENLVEFHGYSNNVLDEMKKCLCVLFPSKSEAQPLTILESLSVGTPVVAYDCKYGPASMIENRSNGYLVEIGDFEKMANYVAKLYNNKELRNSLRGNAQISAQNLTSTSNIFKLWQKVISNI